MKRKNRCPCCGYLTLTAEPPGSYSLCPVCYWEDDDVQFRNPTYKGGANRQSLLEARQNFKKFNASDHLPTNHVRRPTEDEMRINKNGSISLDALEEAFAIIERCGGGDFEGKKEEAQIKKAENILGVTFPPSYKIFLRMLGCGGFDNLEFYGLMGQDFENSRKPDAIWFALDQREIGLPDHLVPISWVRDETYCALDTREIDVEGECCIVVYDGDGNGDTEVVAYSFGSFFLGEVEHVSQFI
jgi:hypothetical protein